MALDDNQKLQIRMNLALAALQQANGQAQPKDLGELYDWVVGQQSSIVPIKSFTVVKPE